MRRRSSAVAKNRGGVRTMPPKGSQRCESRFERAGSVSGPPRGSTELDALRDRLLKTRDFRDVTATKLVSLHETLATHPVPPKQQHEVAGLQEDLGNEIGRQEQLVKARMRISRKFDETPPQETDAALRKFDFETEKQELALQQKHQQQRDDLDAQNNEHERERTRLVRKQRTERQSFAQNRAIDRRRLQERARLARIQEQQTSSKLPPLRGKPPPKRKHGAKKEGEGNASDYEYDEVDEAQGNRTQQRQDKGVQKVKGDPPEGLIDVIGQAIEAQ